MVAAGVAGAAARTFSPTDHAAKTTNLENNVNTRLKTGADACTALYPTIGLIGPAGVGKDTVADCLVIHAQFRKYSFADALRTEIAEAYDIPVELLLNRETKETPMERLALRQCSADRFTSYLVPLLAKAELLDMDTPLSPRTLMQHWGDYRRHRDPNYWVAQVRAAIGADRLRAGMANGIVLADCRYDNEAQLVRGYYGGVIWKIERPSFEAKPGHTSESSGAQFAPDDILSNATDIPGLHVITMLALACTDKGAAG